MIQIYTQIYDAHVYANIKYRYIRKTQMCRQIYDADVDNAIVLRVYDRDAYTNLRF